jgi:hypothetical protein
MAARPYRWRSLTPNTRAASRMDINDEGGAEGAEHSDMQGPSVPAAETQPG